MEYIEKLFVEHNSGRRDHSGRLWALFMLELWTQSFGGHRASREVGAVESAEKEACDGALDYR